MMLVVLAGLAQLVLAGVLTLSALSKSYRPSRFGMTLRELGLPRGLSTSGAAVLIVAELATGVTLVVAPGAGWPRVAVLVLAVGFAGAGAWALATGRRVACHCFGPGQHTTLGVRQLVVLPGWLALCGLAQVEPPTWTAAQGLGLLAFIVFGGSAVRLVRAWPLWQDLRADRISLR